MATNYYMGLNPFTLTNIETLETKEFKNFDDILTAALKASCTVYVYDLDKLARTIVNKLDKLGFAEEITNELENGIMTKIGPKKFITVGSVEERTTVLIRARRTVKAQTVFQNAHGLFGKATIEDICMAAIGENDEIFGMCAAIDNLLSQGHTAWTLAGNALKDLKNECFANKEGKYADLNFKERFPKLEEEVHNFVMSSFQGGICYFNPKFQGTFMVKGTEYDVNSMYPSVMLDEFLPYGEPTYFEGQFDTKITIKPYYFQRVTIEKLTIMADGVPCIRNKQAKNYFTIAENVELVLNHIDMEMLFDNYTVEGIKYVDGYRFDARKKMFDKFINKWAKQKQEAEDGSFERMYAKLMLNSAFGKFASKTDKRASYYKKTKDGVLVRQKKLGNNKTEGQSVYAPVGAYITSFARQRLIKAIKANKENFIYSDTDSIYVKGEAVGLELDPKKFGAWKEEFKFDKMCVLGKKYYCVQKTDGTIKVSLAGIPDRAVEENIKTFDDFHIGKKIDFSIVEYDFEGIAAPKKMPTIILDINNKQ